MAQENTTQEQTNITGNPREKGQSIVIVALALVGLLAFVGIAVDVGFIFARSSQLQSAVDAAALAGVTEVQRGLNAANQRAGQFLNANNIPISVTQSLQSRQNTTLIGETEYSITVTWPVELFFLKLIGLENYTLQRSATAAYFPQADIYASRRVDQGVISSSNQSIFGPQSCTAFGDPYSPFTSPWAPGAYTYNYRILIPSNYPSDVLRIEIFDPDSINKAGTTENIYFSSFARAANPTQFPAGPQARSCTGDSAQRHNACLIVTGERNLVNPTTGVTIDNVNPFWLVRVDENRGPNCTTPGSYNQANNTGTLYEIFYYRENADGTLSRVPLASYTGQRGGEPVNHDTDLRWVSPGGPLKPDQTVPVPVNPGSEKTFHLSISADLPNILTDQRTGNRYVYLDVTAMSGSSENGYEVWAGPWYPDVPSNGNSRNLYIIDNPGSSASMGATVFGMGVLPMNSNATEIVDIPLMYVGTEMIGESIFVSTFDMDSGARPPIIFYFDSLAFKPNDSATDGVDWSATDWALSFGGGATDPAGRCFRGGASYANGCDNRWISPPYEIVVPGNLANCNYSSPTMADCTPFYGGRLVARYRAGAQDTYVWRVNTTGTPYLVR